MAAMPIPAGADPFTTMGASFLSGLGSGLTAPGGPSNVSASSPFDSSGWNVNFGAGTIESSRSQAAALTGYMPYVVAAAAVLIAWRLTRRK